MSILVILGIIAAGAIVWFISGYNRLISLKNLLDEAWSGIDVQLKRRYDLIPNLVATVKQYSLHEKGILESIAQARAASMSAPTVEQKSAAESELTKSLRTLFAVAENYPDLKANQNFLALQSELSTLESDIQLSRRYYNGAARNYNVAVQSFPRSIIASMFGFSKADYFQASASERENQQVTF
jgi:LemA protein